MVALNETQKRRILNYERFINELSINDIWKIFTYYKNEYDPNRHKEPLIKQLLMEFFSIVLGGPVQKDSVIEKNIDVWYTVLSEKYKMLVAKKYLEPQGVLPIDPNNISLQNYYNGADASYNRFKELTIEKVVHYLYDIHNHKYDCLVKDKSYMFTPEDSMLSNLYDDNGDGNVNKRVEEFSNQPAKPNGNSYTPNPLGFISDEQLVNGVPSIAKSNRWLVNEVPLPSNFQGDRMITKEFKVTVTVNLDQLQRMNPKTRYDYTMAVVNDYLRLLIAGVPLFPANFQMNFQITKL